MYVETKAFKTLTIDHDVYVKNNMIIEKALAEFPKNPEMTPWGVFNRQGEERVVYIFSPKVNDQDLYDLSHKIIEEILAVA